MQEAYPEITIRGYDCELSPNIKKHLNETEYWVEATQDEVTMLYAKIAKDAKPNHNKDRVEWKEEYNGSIIPIAYYNDHKSTNNPITIELRFALIDNIKVGFYHSNGFIVHFGMMEKFLTLHSPSFKDARNNRGTAHSFHPERKSVLK